ncbi:MAG: hypothetical protein U9O84_04885, partial [Chloroflexota bacterium]|nr:hypothetical protein [Chloroflexota bacterium]
MRRGREMQYCKTFRILLCCVLLLTPALTSPAKAQVDDVLPVIHSATVIPTDVHPGDTMVVVVDVSDPTGVSSVTANMGGIETISLSLV